VGGPYPCLKCWTCSNAACPHTDSQDLRKRVAMFFSRSNVFSGITSISAAPTGLFVSCTISDHRSTEWASTHQAHQLIEPLGQPVAGSSDAKAVTLPALLILRVHDRLDDVVPTCLPPSAWRSASTTPSSRSSSSLACLKNTDYLLRKRTYVLELTVCSSDLQFHR
jgi:hypothetical protein